MPSFADAVFAAHAIAKATMPTSKLSCFAIDRRVSSRLKPLVFASANMHSMAQRVRYVVKAWWAGRLLTTISNSLPLMRLAAKFNQTGAASFDVPKWAVNARLPRHVRKSSRKLRRVPSSQMTYWFDLTRMMKGLSWSCKKSTPSPPMNSRSARRYLILSAPNRSR